ncbi:MAG: CoA-binding protein [Candidatus Omnitrophica bacterium]|nr:CoA-binding protein [Candidatus Omnitrophota bacterium]
MNVVLVGASRNPDRYAYLAFQLLREHGHTVFPVHPTLPDVDGVTVFSSIKAITGRIHTMTLYVSKVHSDTMIDEILAQHPSRIIFNPGAENDDLQASAKAAGIETLKACTLVLLTTGKF